MGTQGKQRQGAEGKLSSCARTAGLVAGADHSMLAATSSLRAGRSLRPRLLRSLSTAAKDWPSFLTPPTTTHEAVDVLETESEDIHFNLATEEYIFEHVNVCNPLLFLWRNTPAIIMGKHQNPWKECRVQLIEEDGIALARRPTGGGCVYRDLGDSGFSFVNPHASAEDASDFKTFNNEVLLDALTRFGIEGEMSGRNDLTVGGRKVSGSAYRLRVGNADGEGRRSLHHGTMLLNLDLTALGKYLSPNKLKMQSKGVSSVAARVLNLSELVPSMDHAGFCNAAAAAFAAKWSGHTVNRRVLAVSELERIPKLMELYKGYSEWEWRFGKSPSFSHSLEHKFDWALLDVHVDVVKGVITNGRVFSDCLVPPFIDALNHELSSGTKTTYDVAGIADLCARTRVRLGDDESLRIARDQYLPQLQEWLSAEI